MLRESELPGEGRLAAVGGFKGTRLLEFWDLGRHLKNGRGGDILCGPHWIIEGDENILLLVHDNYKNCSR
jgi:hypothetical protein